MDHQTEVIDAIISSQLRLNGSLTTATLTSGGQLCWSGQSLAVEKEVLGFSVEGNRIVIRTLLESGAGICFGGSSGNLVRRSYVFEPLSEESLSLWSRELREYIDSLGRPKRLYVLVNPYGGKKSALAILAHHVKPLLEDANIEYVVEETRYQFHAKEIANKMDLTKYDGIVCVSGDGLLVEVVNGLLERDDWDSAIKTPLGVIPAGTSNGMAKSLLDSVGEPCKASNATLSVIRGHKRSLDVAAISQGDKRFFSVLMLAWGLVADIDIESEKYRWMGSARMDFYALQRILHLRKYNGRIVFVPAPGYETYGEPVTYGVQEIECVHDQHQWSGYQGPDVNLKDLNWRKIDGPFVSIWLHNVPWGSEDTMAAPDAEFSDGYLDLIITKDCPKLALISLLTALNNGGHVKSPHVLYFKAKSFILEPGPRTEDPTKEGIIDVDGEVLARGKGTLNGDQKALMSYDKLLIKVDKGLATLFSPI